MNQLNKLQMGEWLMQHIESDETSCCYLADGAESQQVDYLGQLLSRRVNGKLEIKAHRPERAQEQDVGGAGRRVPLVT